MLKILSILCVNIELIVVFAWYVIWKELTCSELSRDHLYMVMECGSRDLAKYIHERRKGGLSLEPREIDYIWWRMLNAIKTIHDQGTAHSSNCFYAFLNDFWICLFDLDLFLHRLCFWINQLLLLKVQFVDIINHFIQPIHTNQFSNLANRLFRLIKKLTIFSNFF